MTSPTEYLNDIFSASSTSVTGILPCSGKGKRVRHLLPDGVSKETMRCPNNIPIIHQHLDFMLAVENIRNIVVTVNSEKGDTIREVLRWLQDAVKDYNPLIKEVADKYASINFDKLLGQRDPNTAFVARIPNALVNLQGHSVGLNFVSAPDHSIVENPVITIQACLEILTSSYKDVNFVGDDVDVFISLPDIYYTNPRSVIHAIQSNSFKTRAPKLCAINSHLFTSVDLSLSGRMILNESLSLITQAVSVKKDLADYPDAVYGEVGLMYGRASEILDPSRGEWIYDRIKNAQPILIESEIINFGDPSAYGNDDPVSILDTEESDEFDPELEEDDVA